MRHICLVQLVYLLPRLSGYDNMMVNRFAVSGLVYVAGPSSAKVEPAVCRRFFAPAAIIAALFAGLIPHSCTFSPAMPKNNGGEAASVGITR